VQHHCHRRDLAFISFDLPRLLTIIMRIILFGGTGMIGQGVLRECLQSSDVLSVLSVGRRRIPDNLLSMHHDLSLDKKLQQVQSDNFAAIDWSKYGDFDACFWCVGVSSVGISDHEYTKVMRDLCFDTIQHLGKSARRPPALVYISAFGADSTQQSSTHWKRVRGETEQLLLDRAQNSGDTSKPFRDVYIFRPAFVQPLDNVRSSVAWYNWVYRSLSLITPLLQSVLPGMTSTRNIGRACVHLARQTSYRSGILTSREINRFAEG
jgi:hypothetical protein